MLTEEQVTKLRDVFAWLSLESRKKKLTRTHLSHAFSRKFREQLESSGHTVVETGNGNSNYFCVSIDGAIVAISPFCSHEGWWEDISDGFRRMYSSRGCRWGVVLLNLPDESAVWIEGRDYLSAVLGTQQKIHASDVISAEAKGVAHRFHDISEFISLIRIGPKKKTFVRKKL